jgi:hypothetical protein
MSDALSSAEIDGYQVELLPARTGIGLNVLNINVLGDQTNSAADGVGGAGGSANGGNG